MFPQWLAQFSPLTPEFQLGFISILAVAVLVQSLRRKPPIGEDLIKLSGAIEALNKAVEDLTKANEKHLNHATEIEQLKEKVRLLDARREADQRAFQEKLAALDGRREEDQARNRSYTAQSTERIFKRIDELAASVSANFQSVERTLGQLEGKVSAIADR